MKQGQHGVATLGPLSPPSLIPHLLPLGWGLQTLVRLMGTSRDPGSSLGYGLFGIWLFSPRRVEKQFKGLMKAPLHFSPPTPSASLLLTAFGSLSLLARLVLTALDWFPWAWCRVQTLHQLLHPSLLRVCTELWLGALPR